MTTWQALLWLWLSLPPTRPYEPPMPLWWSSGSIVRTDALHLGVRPASDAIQDVAATVQVTLRTPW